MQRYIERVQRDERREAHLLRHLTPLVSATEEKGLTASSATFYQQPAGKRGAAQPVQLLSMKGPVRVAKKPSSVPVGVLPEKLMAQQAMVGPWQRLPDLDTTVPEAAAIDAGLSHREPTTIRPTHPPPLQGTPDKPTGPSAPRDEPTVESSSPSLSDPPPAPSSSPSVPADNAANAIKIEFRKFTKPANLRK